MRGRTKIIVSLQTLCGAALALLLIGIAGCGESEISLLDVETDLKTALAPANLVLTNGKVVTVDDALGTQQALAVTGHTITAIGSNEDIAPYRRTWPLPEFGAGPTNS